MKLAFSSAFKYPPAFVVPQTDYLAVCAVAHANGSSEGEKRLHLQKLGAPPFKRVREPLLPIDQRLEGFAVARCAIEPDLFKARLLAPPFQPMNLDAPPAPALMHEAQRFFAFLACVGKGHDHIVRQLAIMGAKDFVKHERRRATA